MALVLGLSIGFHTLPASSQAVPLGHTQSHATGKCGPEYPGRKTVLGGT